MNMTLSTACLLLATDSLDWGVKRPIQQALSLRDSVALARKYVKA